MRRALITGVSGFVGGHLAERLTSDGWEVRGLVRPGSDTRAVRALGVQLWEGHLGDPHSIRRAADGVEVVFHLAAVNFARTEADFLRANVEGTRNVVEALAAAETPPRRLVHLSSYAACGPAPDGRPRRLEDPPAPLTAYGRSKLAGEEVARTATERGIEVIVLRAPAVYGPGDRAMLGFYRLVRRGLAPGPGGAAERLQLIYAPDLALALARAADAPQGTFPVADPVERSWAEMVDAVAAALDRRPLRVTLPPPLVRLAARLTEGVGALAGRVVPFSREKAEEMLARAWVCDLEPSGSLLPRERATPLDQGVARTVRWYTREGWL